MGWDVIAIRLTTDTGIEGISTCMAARSGGVSESYLHDSIAPVVLGRDPHDREAIFHDLWNIDRHEAFFPVFLPGPVDVALWDICAKAAGAAALPIHRGISDEPAGFTPAETSTGLYRNMWTKRFTTKAKASPAISPSGRSGII